MPVVYIYVSHRKSSCALLLPRRSCESQAACQYMQQFDNKLDAVLYAEALLAGVSMKDAEIAQVTKKFRRETLEQMNILLADPKARAVVRLQLFAKGESRYFCLLRPLAARFSLCGCEIQCHTCKLLQAQRIRKKKEKVRCLQISNKVFHTCRHID